MNATSSTDERRGRIVNVLVALLFVGCALTLFRLSLFQGWTFIGDSDRLNTVLNVRLFEVLSIQQRGSVPTWSDRQFMGAGIVGLHWMLPGAPPLPQILALLPTSELYRALAFLAAGLFACAMGAAYWALGAYSSNPVQRVVGAILYATASYTVHKLMQLDLSFVALVAPPILHRLVFATRRETAPWTFLGMAACWSFLVLFTVLQEIAYLGMFWGLYALYRTIRLRDPWPLLVTVLAFGAGVLIGVPRVATIAADVPFVTRTTSNIQITAVEALRYFGDGLLGRSQGEQGLLRGGYLNMHEGVQLLSSGLAALAVIVCGVLAPSRWLRFWSAMLAVVLSVALNAYARSFFELEAFGLRGVAYPSRELRTIVVNALLMGVPLWLLGWLATRKEAPPPTPPHCGGEGRLAPLSTAVERGWGWGFPGHARDDDLPFFFGFVVLALAVILIPEARLLFYYGFFRIDFQHSRLSVATILPLAAIAVVYLGRFFPPSRDHARGRGWGWGVCLGLIIGLALWLVREFAAETLVAQLGPAVEQLRPRRLLTVETVRVATSLLVLLVSAVLLVWRPRASWLTVAGGVLACWMSLEALTMTEHRMNGPQTTQQAQPFTDLDYLQVPPGGMRIPTPDERAALRMRLEADRYRTVLLQDRRQFNAMTEPHLVAFWDLRTIEGYSTGLPRRLGSLPWEESMTASQHLDIHAIIGPQNLPWRLLAALNVKYVVQVDPSLWSNPAPGGPVPPLDLAKLQVWENPNPVSPRAFFAARVTPAGSIPLLAGDDGRRPALQDPPIEDPARHSVVEGVGAERSYATDGVPDATFDGDRVHVRVEPVSQDRFLVLNELYHPSWKAWVDGAPATIYPTNVVMRGIVVPAGASTVELRYEPFITSGAGYGLLAFALLLVPLLAWCLRRIDLTARAPYATRRRRTT